MKILHLRHSSRLSDSSCADLEARLHIPCTIFYLKGGRGGGGAWGRGKKFINCPLKDCEYGSMANLSTKSYSDFSKLIGN